jgi:type II secretory pathway predicted ATPase ExeA
MSKTKRKEEPMKDVLVGSSQMMNSLREMILKIAQSDSPVLITGEPGSGKGIVARLLHQYSKRSAGPFVAVNIAAMPAELAKAQLLGHTKGAFTGAIQSRAGLFEIAQGGTIFLDELEQTPVEVQILLLRVIESSTIRRLGENEERIVNARVIAAARSELVVLARDETIRLDLLYRIAATTLRAPPLRERLQDVPELVDYFLSKQKIDVKIDSAAVSVLKQYDYPGNVRELFSILMRAAVTCNNKTVTPNDLVLPTSAPATQKEDSITLRAQLDVVRKEMDHLRRNSIYASPIWEGRAFPTESDYCFVLMPFSDTLDLQKVYQDHVKPVLEKRCGLRCERADDIYDISGVMQSVWEGINRARLVIADLTGRNPNVFYELGIAHTLGKPVIMLTQSMEFVPFDLRHLRCIVYEYKPGSINKLQRDLEKTVHRVLSGTPDSPSQKLTQA